MAGQLSLVRIFLGFLLLLVLVGATYSTRLWCLMELFTFIQMGGERERITVCELSEGARSGLATFDAAKASCFLVKDKHKLLAVIEAGFGDLQPFNRVVRALLTRERAAESTTTWRRSLTGRITSRITRSTSSRASMRFSRFCTLRCAAYFSLSS